MSEDPLIQSKLGHAATNRPAWPPRLRTNQRVFFMPKYTDTEINRLAKETENWRWWSLDVSLSFDKGTIVLYRFLLIGGPPPTSKASTLVSVVPAMAKVITLDCDEAYLLGVTLQPCASGQELIDTKGEKFNAPDGSYLCDVIFKSLSSNYFKFFENETEDAARAALASWGGGYATSVKMLGFLLSHKAKPDSLGALEFWGQQPPLFYARAGQDPTPQRNYTDGVRQGSVGIGFGEGLSDFPGTIVPFKWGTGMVQPDPDPIGPDPIGPNDVSPNVPSGSAASTQNMLLMGAGVVVGYLGFRRWFS